jgi:hypothetical protein
MDPKERSGIAWPESLAKATTAIDATVYALMAAPIEAGSPTDYGRCQKDGSPIRPRRDQARGRTRAHDARHEALVALPTRALRRLRREGSRPSVIVRRPRVEDIVGVMIAKGRSRVWRLCVVSARTPLTLYVSSREVGTSAGRTEIGCAPIAVTAISPALSPLRAAYTLGDALRR